VSYASPSKLRPAAIGGAALGIASAIPVLNLANCACCALVIGGGVLAAYLYCKEQPPSTEAPYGDAFLLGILTGVIGALIGSIVSIPFQLLVGGLGAGESIQQALQQADLPPEVAELVSKFGSGELAFGAIVFGLLVSLVVYTIFATIGALIGTAIFHRKAS